MSNFEAAVLMFEEYRFSSFPDPKAVSPPYEHSKDYEKRVRKLFDKMRGDKLHRFTRRTTRMIIIAAILLAFATVVLAATVGKDFIVHHFSNYATYEIVDNEDNFESASELYIGYIPEGFRLTDSLSQQYSRHSVYENEEYHFVVVKDNVNNDVSFNSSYKLEEKISINSISYLYYVSDNDITGFIWNYNDYVYRIDGNIPKEELLKIAQSVA